MLAIDEAARQQVDTDIVLATIEAETGGKNVMGDKGNAYGYGQVWVKWHKDSFEYAAKRLNITLPGTNEGIKQLTLSNNTFSMIVAVKTIKKYWIRSGKNWRTFTLSYVGPAISNNKHDYERREKIWLKYRNGSGVVNVVSSDHSTQSNANIFNPNYEIPQETYSVDVNSESKGNILYGRKYRVLITNNGGKALDVSQLRCSFSVSKTILMQPNYSEVILYNLNAETENTIIKEGMRIVIEAGYIGEQYGRIFDGDILQPIRDKEDGVTYKLTLTSLDGDKFLNFGFANFSILRGQSLRGVADQVISKAKNPSQLGDISQGLSNSKLTRGKVVFGLAKNVLRQIAQTESATFYVDNNKVNIIKASDVPKGQVISLSPASGLIGVPSQNEYGVVAKSLLNPRITLNSLVHIDNSLIRARKAQVGEVIRALDTDGLYRVIKLTYKGDTRGDDWYTEIETVSQAGIIPNMLGNVTMNPW